MPFSLASASMVCCSGFDLINFQISAVSFQLSASALSIQLELPFQMCPRDRRERHAVRLAIVGFDQHVGALDAGELAPKKPLAVDPLAHDDLREPAGEPPV